MTRASSNQCSGRYALLMAVAIVLSSVKVLFASSVYPLPGADSNAYMPAAIVYANTGKLENPVFSLADNPVVRLDDHRFLWQPPLFPMVIGALMPTADARNAFVTLSIISSITLSINLLIWLIALQRSRTTDWLTLLTCVSALFACSAILLSLQKSGRPESLVALFCSLMVLCGIQYLRQLGGRNIVIGWTNRPEARESASNARN